MTLEEDRAWRSDLHTHTTYSDGRTLVADSVRMAEVAGLSTLAITDHVFDAVEATWVDRMLRDVAAAHGSAVRVLSGVEGYVRTARGDLSVPPELGARVDLVLADLGHRTVGIGCDLPTSRHAFMRNVVSAYVGACERRPLDILAHPFNTGRFRPDVRPTDFAPGDLRDIAQAMAGGGVRFEIMNQMVWWFPDRPVVEVTAFYTDLVRAFAAEGVTFTLGSDAHSCCGVGNLAWSRRVAAAAGVEERLWSPGNEASG